MTNKKPKQAKVKTFVSPESSNVEGASYNPATGECVIAFRNKKDPNAERVYYTYTITSTDWEAFEAAESKGRHVLRILEPKYRGVRIGQ